MTVAAPPAIAGHAPQEGAGLALVDVSAALPSGITLADISASIH